MRVRKNQMILIIDLDCTLEILSIGIKFIEFWKKIVAAPPDINRRRRPELLFRRLVLWPRVYAELLLTVRVPVCLTF